MGSSKEMVVDISRTANKFRSSIVLNYEDKWIDTKSILGLFTSIVNAGKYQLQVIGPDEEEAKQAMRELFDKYGVDVDIW